jgi:hypothetical protein
LTCQKHTTPTPKCRRRKNKSQRHKLHDTLLSSQTSHASEQTSRSVSELVILTPGEVRTRRWRARCHRFW